MAALGVRPQGQKFVTDELGALKSNWGALLEKI